jgi:predicted transcriptional regulator
MFKETQSVNELKSSIHSLVEEVQSVALLKKVEKELKAEKEDWWDELSPSQKRSIKKGVKEVETGKIVTHSEMKKTFSKLRKKWATK